MVRALDDTLREAERMIDVFTSVGATRFDLTFLDIEGRKRGFRADQTAKQVKNSLPLLFPGLSERRNSLVVRPHNSGNVVLVQLDDLDVTALERVEQVALLTLATSPRNHQAWIAVEGLADAERAKDFARRLRKGTGADLSASGATRMAGTLNFKKKYDPEFPMVSIVQATPGKTVTCEQLESMGLVADREPAAKAAPLRVSPSYGRKSWPDYQRCVENAPLNHGRTGPDISRADFFWCMMCAQRGWSAEEIASRLIQLSGKAREGGEEYARMTARNAVAASDRSQRSRT